MVEDRNKRPKNNKNREKHLVGSEAKERKKKGDKNSNSDLKFIATLIFHKSKIFFWKYSCDAEFK